MKKILYITYYWPPSGGAGVQRSLKFVKYLPALGISPIVLTVDPSKASYPLRDESLEKEVDSSVLVIRTDSFEPLQILSKISDGKKIPYGGFANPGKEKFSQKALRFIRGNFFIPDARKGWVRYAVKAASRVIREEQLETVVISSPPHSSQLIGLELKKIFPNLRWIADLRDPWTDIYYYQELLHTAPAKRRDEKLERKVLEQCSAAITVSEDIRRLFLLKSTAVVKSKVHVIPNGYDPVDFEGDVVPVKEHFLVTYVGTIADTYNPEVFFSAFRAVMDANQNVSMRIRFVGSLSGLINEYIRKYKLENSIEIIGHVSHGEAIQYMQTATVLLLVIPDVKDARGILTGKLFEYIGAKRPVLGIGPADGDAAKILAECIAGRMFERTDPTGVESWLQESVNRWKLDTAFREGNREGEKYSRKELTSKLATILLDKQ